MRHLIMSISERAILKYCTSTGKTPFDEWFKGLKDKKSQAIIDARLLRLRIGNLGQYRDLGGGVKELKIPFGPGFRLYFSEINGTVVILLLGGDKSSQERDIEKAKMYLADYRSKGNV